MEYTNKLIDKIYNYKSITNTNKISKLLEIDANQYCNLGKNSSKSEKEVVKKNSKYIYKTISKLDTLMGKKFLELQDK